MKNSYLKHGKGLVFFRFFSHKSGVEVEGHKEEGPEQPTTHRRERGEKGNLVL